MLEKISEENRKKILFAVYGISAAIITFTIFAIKNMNTNRDNQTVTVERVTSKYNVLSSSGPSPLTITVQDTQTKKIYEDSFVSASCPLYSQKVGGLKEIELTRFTNVVLATDERKYFFKGAYENFCTNLKFNPQSGSYAYQGR